MQKLFTILLLFALGENAFAQQLELFATGTPSGAGPTTSPGTATFQLSNGASTTSFTPTITVSYSFSQQMYTGNGTPGMVAGGGSFGATATAPAPMDIFQPLNAIGNPSNAHYTADPFGTAGTGIDVAVNEGMWMYTDVTYLQGQSLSSRYEYGNLTLTFSRPVLNPVIHLAGIGALTYTTSNASGNPTNALGYYTEFQLAQTAVTSGYTLTRLSGSEFFSVPTSGSTANIAINNSSPRPTTVQDFDYYHTQSAGNSGSGGSVRVNTNGTPITSITFRVFVRGDGGVGTNNAWLASNTPRAGDAFTVSVSLPTYAVSGNVFNDANALADGKVNSTSTTPIPSTLRANLVDAHGNIYASTLVPSSGANAGQYSFPNVLASNYTVVLTNNGSTSTVASLPSSWSNTGENVGAPTVNGHDGLIDGRLAIAVGASATVTAVTNANFGIKEDPALGLELTRFDASAAGCNARIGWKAVSEAGIASYDVQFSRTGEARDFATVATIVAGRPMYEFEHAQPAGEGFYRLRVTSVSGAVSYSGMRNVRTSCGQAQAAISLSPNPTQGIVKVSGLQAGSILRLFDLNGKMVITTAANGTTSTVDLSTLPSGTYQLTVAAEGSNLQSFKVVKQ